MLGMKFNPAKCETTCRLCLGRIKLLRNKRQMQIANYRKDIAELLRTGKQDYARIRVEAVIRESLTLQAYDILELFLELLAMRAPLVANTKEVPRDMTEALSSVLYAAARVPDLPELQTLHKMFAQKYGKEYVQSASSDTDCHRWNVNEKLRRCVTVEPPEPSLKLEVLSEIAQEYKVEWDLDRARREMLPADGALLPPPPASGPGGSGGGYGGGGSGGGGGGYGMMMQVPGPAAGVGAGGAPAARPGAYQDARQAAAAAAAAAAEAQRAADYAQHLAGGTGSPVLRAGAPPGGFSGAPAPPSPLAGAGGSGAVAPPPVGWLSGAARPPGAPAAAGGPFAPSSTASAPADLGPYRARSQEEVQRAYDAAQGPPPKPDLSAAPPPPPAAAPAPAPAPPAAPAADDSLDLPSAPRPGGPAAAGGSGGVDSELDELQKRFDALKKH